jgi:hypothetical protein
MPLTSDAPLLLLLLLLLLFRLAPCSELNAKLEWFAHASAALGLDAPWEQPLTAEASSGSAPGSHPISLSPPTSSGGAQPAAPAAADSLPSLPGQPAAVNAAASAVAESQEVPADAAAAAAAALLRKNSGSMTQRSMGGDGVAAASGGGSSSAEVAAVEALAAAMPLRMSTQVLRTSAQERRGEEL